MPAWLTLQLRGDEKDRERSWGEGWVSKFSVSALAQGLAGWGGGWTEADRACCSYRMHAEPRMDQTRCSGHSVSGTHGLADQLNARSHQMTLGRLNRVLRPHAHEMHISYAWPPLFYGKTTELWLFLSELYTTLAICRQHATTKSACEPLLKPNVCLTFWVYL